MRKGRLDEIFYVDLPTSPEREEIFKIHINRKGRDAANFDLTALADSSEAFSGAEIEESINSALYEAFYTGGDLKTKHIQAALSETVPLSRTMSEAIERQRATIAGRARDASRPRIAESL
jgi:SpoVK/Ycf46/Vps4 family AAA+-type ATPase